MERKLDFEALVLVVDDDPINLRNANRILHDHYKVACADSGESAFHFLENTIPDLMLLDLHMPQMDGFEVMHRLQEKEAWADIPVIMLTADNDSDTEVKCLQEGAMDYIIKPFVAQIVLQRVQRLLELNHLKNELQVEVAKQTQKAEERRMQIEEMSLQTVQALANAIDAKDQYTKGHSVRVSEYSVLLATELGWEEEKIADLKYAALLHDIGKIGIPDSILNKKEKLSDLEFTQIKRHTTMGSDILKNISTFAGAETVARHHHERYDGSGYPDKLAGKEIPDTARVVCIADAYDAMNSKRIYRSALSKETIRQELIKNSGSQFDPDYMETFIRLFDENRLELPQDRVALEPKDENMVKQSGVLLQQLISGDFSPSMVEQMDNLTGLPMRNVGEAEIARRMSKFNGCMVFVDLDNLKHVNDTQGHKAGDALLSTLGDTLRQHTQGQYACRLGGDEFLLFFANQEEADCVRLVEALMEDFRSRIEDNVQFRAASLSAGICVCTTKDDFTKIYNRADKALYYAKQNGKNALHVYRDEELTTHNVNIDLQALVASLQHSGSYEGAMKVEYRSFAQMFEYLRNVGNRYDHDFQMIMITIDQDPQKPLFIEEMEKAMIDMENAVRNNIRNVDICTRFSSMQFLVILLEAQEEEISIVIDRIFGNFYKLYGDSHIELSYASAVLENKGKEKC